MGQFSFSFSFFSFFLRFGPCQCAECIICMQSTWLSGNLDWGWKFLVQIQVGQPTNMWQLWTKKHCICLAQSSRQRSWTLGNLCVAHHGWQTSGWWTLDHWTNKQLQNWAIRV
jgi:hypothetical protein